MDLLCFDDLGMTRYRLHVVVSEEHAGQTCRPVKIVSNKTNANDTVERAEIIVADFARSLEDVPVAIAA